MNYQENIFTIKSSLSLFFSFPLFFLERTFFGPSIWEISNKHKKKKEKEKAKGKSRWVNYACESGCGWFEQEQASKVPAHFGYS